MVSNTKDINPVLDTLDTTITFALGSLTTNGDLNIAASTTVINASAGTFTSSLAIDLFNPAGISSVTMTKNFPPNEVVTNMLVDGTVKGATARIRPVVGTPFATSIGDTYIFDVYDPGGTPAESGFSLSGDRVNLFTFTSAAERPTALTMDGMQYAANGLRLVNGGTQGTYLSEIIPTQRPKPDGGGETLVLGAVLTGPDNAGQAFGFDFPGIVAGAASSAQKPTAHMTVSVRTGDTPAAVAAAPFQAVMTQTSPTTSVNGLVGGGQLALKKYYQVSATMQVGGGNCADGPSSSCSTTCPSQQPNCHSYYTGTGSPYVGGLYSLPGYAAYAMKPYNLSPGSNVVLTMDPSAANIRLTFPQVNRVGNALAGYYSENPPLGWASIPPNEAIALRNEADVTGPVAVRIDYGTSVSLTPTEEAGLTILRTDPTTGVVAPIGNIVVSTPTHVITGSFPFNGPGNFGTFRVAYPAAFSPTVASSPFLIGNSPEFQISAPASDLGVAVVPPGDPRVAAAVPAAAAGGRILAGNLYQTQTGQGSFLPGGLITFRFDPAALGERQIDESTIRLYYYDPSLGSFVPVTVQSLDQGGAVVTSTVSAPGIYALFGSPPAFLSPASGVAGTTFTITGFNFGVAAGTSTQVLFGAASAPVTQWTGSKITGTVPALSAGDYAVTVERANAAALSAGTFTVTAASTGPVVALSPYDGALLNVSTLPLVASYASSAGIVTGSVRLALDGVDVTTQAEVTSSSAAFAPAGGLRDGSHLFTASVADGNAEAASSTSAFIVDTVAPVTTLLADDLVVAGAATTQNPGTVYSLYGTDSGSGVADIQFYVDVDALSCDAGLSDPDAPAGTCANPFYNGPFTLALGTHTLSYFSYDEADNTEYLNEVTVTVSSVAAPNAPAGLTVASITPRTGTGGSPLDVAVTGTEFDWTASLALERPDVYHGTWTPVATMSPLLGSPIGTVLTDGRVLVIGSLGATSAAAALFNPSSGTWTAAPSMPAPLYDTTPVLLKDGRVLVAGGYPGPQGTASAAAEIFDPRTNTWTAAAAMRTPRAGAVMALLSDGRVLAAGGRTGNASDVFLDYQAPGSTVTTNLTTAADVFDPITGTWSPVSDLNIFREAAASVQLADGRTMIAGGAGQIGTVIPGAIIFDPAANGWTPAGEMVGERAAHTLALLPDGRVIAAGGYGDHGGGPSVTPVRTTSIYNPATNTWTAGPTLNIARTGHRALTVGGRVVLIGGTGPDGPLDSIEVYDPVSNSWSLGPSMLAARPTPVAAILPDGNILATRGSSEVLSLPTQVLPASGLSVADSHHLSGSLNLQDAAAGDWNVTVRESDGRVGQLISGFRILSPAPSPVSLDVVPATAAVVLDYAASARFLAIRSFSDGSRRVQDGWSWSSDAPSVATVTPQGLATGLTPGAARIAASSGALSGSSALIVQPPTVLTLSSLSVVPSSAVITSRRRLQYSAVETLAVDGSTHSFSAWTSWSSDAPGIASISTSGAAVGGRGGIAHITATFGPYTSSGTLTVLPPPLDLYSIDPSTADVNDILGVVAAGDGLLDVSSLRLERRDARAGDWTAAAPLPPQLSYSPTRAVTLQDGRVFFAGGGLDAWGRAFNAATAAIYDQRTGAWTQVPSMSAARSDHTLVVLADGRVLAAGGTTSTLAQAPTCEIFDPATNTWSPTGPLPSPHANGLGVLLRDGRVLVAGGLNPGFGGTVETALYDPISGSWSPGPPMDSTRYFGAVLRLDDGRVLVTGGNLAAGVASGSGQAPSASAQIYDPVANAWSSAGSMASNRFNHGMARLPGGRIMVVGGRSAYQFSGTNYYWNDFNRTSEIYDPATNAWTTAASLSTGREGTTAASAGGRVIVFAGASAPTTEIYDVATDSWTYGAQTLMKTFTVPKPGWTILRDGRIFLMGGSNNNQGTANYGQTAVQILGMPVETIPATAVSALDDQHVAGGLDLTGAATGYWDVVVGDSAGRVGRLADGFDIRTASTSLLVNPRIASLSIGAGLQFHAFEKFIDGSTSAVATTWSSDAPAIASVTAAGLVTGVSIGSAHITATGDGYSRTAAVTVHAPLLRARSVAFSSAPALGRYAAVVSGAGFDAGAAMRLERPDVFSGVWQAAAQPPRGVGTPRLTPLDDGRILMLDALGAGASIFDPASGQWSSAPPLAATRSLPAVAVLDDGRVLVAAGGDASAEVFDAGAAIWSPAGTMSAARTNSRATRLRSGKVLVTGGTSGSTALSTAELYDPWTNAWTSAAPMGTARAGHEAALLADGRVLVFGGASAASTTTSAEIYDPAADSWTPTGAMTAGRADFASTLLPDGRVLAAGGAATGEVYDPGTGAWSPTGAMLAAADPGIALVDGRPIVIGGGAVGSGATPDQAAQTYIAEANAWVQGPALVQHFGGGARAAALSDGRLLAVAPSATTINRCTTPFGTKIPGCVPGPLTTTPSNLLVMTSTAIVAEGLAPTPAALQGVVDLTAAATGFWDLVVTEPGGRAARLSAALEVKTAPVFNPFADSLPPRTSLSFEGPSFSSGTLFVSAQTTASFAATDDLSVVGDSSGSASLRTFVALDSQTFGLFAGALPPMSDGARTVTFYSVDPYGHAEAVQTRSIAADLVPPVTQLEVLGASTTAGGSIGVTIGTRLSLSAADPAPHGTASGVAATYFVTDVDPFSPECQVQESTSAPRGTCANKTYGGPFTLAAGTHTVYFLSEDNVSNQEVLRTASVFVSTEPPAGALTISGTIGTQGLSAGTAVSVLASSDDFVSQTQLAAFTADGSGSLPYFIVLPASGTYRLAGFAGRNLSDLAPGASVGFYGLSAGVAVDSASATGADFALAADTTPPSAAITSVVDGSSVISISPIQGTALDDLAVGSVQLAARDLTSNLWWNASASSWTASSATAFVPLGAPIVRAALSWSVAAGTDAAGPFGPFTRGLTAGHSYRLYARAADFVGNSGVQTASAAFYWQGGPPSPVKLFVQNSGYRAADATWTAPGEAGGIGQALSFDLRMATFPITSANFLSATPLPGLPAPPPAGQQSSMTITGLLPGVVYYFALETANHEGLTSALSNVVSLYGGDFTAGLDPSGRPWELAAYQSYAVLGRNRVDGQRQVVSSFLLPWAVNSSALGFDGDGNSYAVFTPTAPINGTNRNATVYETSADGVFIDSRTYRHTDGQPAALNQAPYLERADAADSDGDALWIAGEGGSSAGLWKATPAGLTLAGLTAGATAQTVLANGDGAVWMAGVNAGEMTLWRYDVPSGEMRHYGWTNTLGGTGSQGQAIVEDVSGAAWIAGWANTAAGRVAALWQWDGATVNLIAASTGAFSDQAYGLDLDQAGRFWLSGRAQTDSAGTASLALWQYPGSGGTLALSDLFSDAPQTADFKTGRAAVAADGRIWALNGPAPYAVHSRALGLGEISGVVNYPAGFSGGNIGFFTSNRPDFNDGVSFYGLLAAPASGASFSYDLTGLPAPATYYVAAVYDLSGSVANSGQPGAGDPIGLSLSPTPLAAGASANAAAFTLTVDQLAPALAVLAPLAGSSVPASAFSISGTASDDVGIGELVLGLENLGDGTWYDPQSSSFVVSGQPLMTLQAFRSGPANAVAWNADVNALRPILIPGQAYKLYVQASDISGHSTNASSTFYVMGEAERAQSGYALAFNRDTAGNLWTVTQDFIGDATAGVSLRKYDSAGVAISSLPLPGASGNGGAWGLAFDPNSGDVWVGGSADDNGNTDLVVWKVAAANDVLYGTATIASPAGGSIYNGGIASDAAGNAWISGAEQTSPTDFAFRQGLWKVDPEGNTSVAAHFQRAGGGVDGGFATAVDAAGNVWSAGVSSNPATGLLDLAVWKFDSAGTLQSVTYNPGAFLTVANTGAGLVVNPAGGVWVAASQAYPQWNVSDLALLRYDASGVLVSSTLWHGDGAPVIQGRRVALDPSGNVWVTGLSGAADSLAWKYSASGVLAPGFPKRENPDFDEAGVVVDPSGSPWMAYAGEPFVFEGTTTVAGAPGPSPWSYAGLSALSGTITYPAGFAAGSTVTVVLSRDGFQKRPLTFPLVSSGGSSLPYSLSIVAPAAYSIGAFVGAEAAQLTPASPVGFYGHFDAVSLSTYAPTTGVDFALALDSVAPAAAFNGVIDGSTLTALATIQGTATDNVASLGAVQLAAEDLDAGLWWDSRGQDWIASTAPVYRAYTSFSDRGPLDARSWNVDASATRLLGQEGTFGGFSDFLPRGHRFRLLAKAVDMVGNVQPAPTSVDFTWLGPAGASGPPNAVTNLSVTGTFVSSAAVRWTAPGEHQYAGTAFAYDLRVATFPLTAANFASAAAVSVSSPQVAGFPTPASIPRLSTATVYFAALETINHENGISPLSNVVSFALHPSSTTLFDVAPPRTNLASGAPSVSSDVVYATEETSFALTAIDDLTAAGDGRGFGVAATSVSLDGGNYALYAATFGFSGEGLHAASFFSSDTTGNVESTRTVTVAVDLTGADSFLEVQGSSAPDALGYRQIASTTPIALSATDPVTNGVASGAGAIYYVIDTDPFSPDCEAVPADDRSAPGTCANELYAGPFTLTAGTHTVYFLAEDNLLNPGRENVSSFTVSGLAFYTANSADGLASLFSSRAEETVTRVSTTTAGAASQLAIAVQALQPVSALYDLNPSSVPFDPSATLSITFDPAGVDLTRAALYTFDGTSWDSATITDQQLVGLSSTSARLSGTLVHASLYSIFLAPPDVLAPRTTLEAGTPSFASAPLYATDLTTFSLLAADDRTNAGDGLGSGVAQTSLAVDTTTFSVYSGTFSLAGEGTHSVSFYSADYAGNVESSQTVQVALDLTPPISSLSVQGSSATNAQGALVVSSAAPIALSADDPAAAGVASGVGEIFYVVDADPFAPGCAGVPVDTSAPNGTCANELYAGPFTLALGTHTVYFLAEDNVGNPEAVHVSSFDVQTPPPPAPTLSSLAISPASASLSVGASVQFEAVGTFSDASTRAVAALWSSDAPSVATVAATGLATALAPGAATITASSGTVSATATVTVTAPAVTLTSIAVSPSSAAILTSGTQAFTATGYYSDGSSRPFTGGGAWQAKAAMLQGRLGPAGAYLNGKFYAIGGLTQTAEVYDPATNAWTAIAAPPLNWAYARAAAVNGLVYVTGGCLAADCGGGLSAQTWAYDPTANSWTQKASMPAARYDLVFAELGGKLYAAGGTGSGFAASNRLDVYDPATDSWSAAAAMPLSRGQAGGAAAGGKLYVAGGYDGAMHTETMAYDPGTNAWTMRASLTMARAVPASASLGGKIYLIGGTEGATFTLTGATATWVYDPASNAWTEGPEIALGRFDAAGAAGGGTIFVAGGGTGNAASTSLETLEPVSGVAWTTDAPAVATVTAAGLATGLSAGTAHVIASSGAVSGTAALTVQPADATPPVTTLAFSTPSFSSAGVLIAVGTRSWATLTAVDASSGSVPASGVAATYYSVDAPTRPAAVYAGPFQLSSGTHTIYFYSADAGGNAEAVSSATIAVYDGPFAGLIAPSSGPIGAPLSLSGFNFGAYGGATNSQLRFGSSTAPVSVWNDAQISATVPGVATGTYALSVVTLQAGATAATQVGTFAVLAPAVASVTPSSAPIGLSFTVSGTGFGPYASANTQVLIGGATTPISVWNDSTITGTVPGTLSPGSYSLQVLRKAPGGGQILSNAVPFAVVGLNLASVSPSTGPIGIAFSLSGSGFGTYASGNSVVLIGGTTAAISVWNDSTIRGTIPALSTGAYPVVVERIQGAGAEFSNVATFTVTALSLGTPTPSSGPIGTAFTLSGTGYGAYLSASTRLLVGGSTAAVSVWNDATISGTVPGGLAPGAQPVWIERLTGGGLESSNTVYFTVLAPAIASVLPSSAPIGVAFTLSGSGFGAYNGANTQLLVGGTTAPISVWNDATITATVPGALASSTGPVSLVVERIGAGGVSLSTAASFLVLAPSPAAISPSSAPIGSAVTVTGFGFGPYGSANTQLLIGGTTCAVSIWNDRRITATVPALSSGTYPVVIERLQGGYAQLSDPLSFAVVAPAVAVMTPSSAPIGAPFTITGSGFGAYSSVNTHVRFNGVAAPISVWNDTTITGTVPGAASTGTASVVVERAVGAGISSGAAPDFQVLQPTVSTITPSYGLSGTLVTLTGFGFGPYAGASGTQLLVDGSTVALAVWNDSTIRWTVPSTLANGPHSVVVRRTPSGGSIQSEPVNFTVGTSALSRLRTEPALSQLPDVYFVGDLALPASEGGTILTGSQASVVVPPGALPADAEVTLGRDRSTDRDARAAALARGFLSAAGEPVSFGPEGTQFSAPVIITVPYDPALVPAGRLGELAIHYYDPVAKQWSPLATQADPIRRVLTAQTGHFSLYQPLIPGIRTLAAGTFALRDAYAFPNPVHSGAVTLRIQPGTADSVSVRVYDLAGRKIHESSEFAMSVLGGEPTYDHAWNVSGVASGVYTYVLTAKRAGQADVHKTGRIGVVK